MTRLHTLTSLVAVAGLLGFYLAEPRAEGTQELDALAGRAVSEEDAEAAIAELRARGPAGLEALLAVQRAAIQRAVEQPNTEHTAEWREIQHAIDSVGGQRDCYVSRLFWYTDLEQAQAEARRSHKPILSLRLLGKLTDELSCANSRFFRTTLYANQAIADVLRERFVLHWQTVRPVPIVTVDFGDGRKLVSTATGNSVHHLLTADGQPLDALPGLHGPQAFLRWLEQATDLHNETLGRRPRQSMPDNFTGFGSPGQWASDETSVSDLLRKYHRERIARLDRQWAQDMQTLKLPAGNADTAVPSEKTSEAVWQRLAVLHAGDAELDVASRGLIASHHPPASKAALVAVTKSVVESPLVRLLRGLQGTIALDTIRNEYLLHRQIHAWFAASEVGDRVALNERIYSELFLTPSTDPWLGLVPSGYNGLERGGMIEP